ncbi:MAG: hypothetical protein ACK4WD_08740 [Flavobacteriales bacterium]|jgi:uncharacterized membrane protein
MIVLDQPENNQGEFKSPEQVIHEGYNFEVFETIGDGIELFKKDIGNYVLFTLVVLAINFGLGIIPIVGGLASMVISPALTVGYFFVADKIRKGEAYTFNNFFDGFKGPFLQLFLLSLVSGILVLVGTLFCIIPGIWLAISYTLANCILIFHKLEFWDAMEASRKVIAKNFWLFLGTLIVMGLGAVIVTLLTCGLGLFFVTPVIVLTLYAIFIKIFEIK